MTLEQLKEEEIRLRAELSDNLAKQREINIAAFCAKYGAYIGDTISWVERGKQKTGIIEGFSFSGSIPYWYTVNPIKSNGKVGTRISTIYSGDSHTIEVIKKAKQGGLN